jgi:hypothetical protein
LKSEGVVGVSDAELDGSGDWAADDSDDDEDRGSVADRDDKLVLLDDCDGANVEASKVSAKGLFLDVALVVVVVVWSAPGTSSAARSASVEPSLVAVLERVALVGVAAAVMVEVAVVAVLGAAWPVAGGC